MKLFTVFLVFVLACTFVESDKVVSLEPPGPGPDNTLPIFNPLHDISLANPPVTPRRLRPGLTSLASSIRSTPSASPSLGHKDFTPMALQDLEPLKGGPHSFSTLALDSLIHNGGDYKPIFPHAWATHPHLIQDYTDEQFLQLALRTHELMVGNPKLKHHFSQIMEDQLVVLSAEGKAQRDQFKTPLGDFRVMDSDWHKLDADDEPYHSFGILDNDDDDDDGGQTRPFVPKCSKFLPGYDDSNPNLKCNMHRRNIIKGKRIDWDIDDVQPNTDGTKCSLTSTDVCNFTAWDSSRSWPCFKIQYTWTMFCSRNSTGEECSVNTRPPFTRQFRPAENITTGFTTILYPARWVDPVGGQHWGICKPNGGPLAASGRVSGAGPWQCLLTAMFYDERSVTACEGDYQTAVNNGTFTSPCYGETRDCAVHRGQNVNGILNFDQIYGGFTAMYHYPPFLANDPSDHCEPATISGGFGIFRPMGSEEACAQDCVVLNVWVPIKYSAQSYRDSKGRCFGRYT